MTDKFAALKKHGWSEFALNSQPKCPHCGEDFDIHGNEAWHLFSEDDHEVECPSCDGEFKITSIANWTFSTDEQEDDE